MKEIVYSENAIQKISTVQKLENFDWNSEDNEELRKEIRNYYRLEQKGICSYCRQTVSIVFATNCHIEHIAPKSIHPEYIFEPKNLCVICSDCNQIKRDQETIGEIPDTIKKKYKTKYPDKSEDFLIVHPHFDNYDDHILIINGFYIDKASKKGSFTIGACLLNRKLLLTDWEKEIIEETELLEDFNSYIDEPNNLKRQKILREIKKKLFF